MFKLEYIKTMDFTFTNVSIMKCKDIEELCNKIKENEVIKILNGDKFEYVNSSYIMYFG